MKPIGTISSTEETAVNPTTVESNAAQVETSSVEDKMLAHMANNIIHINKDKAAEWDAKETVKGSKAKADAVMSSLKEHIATPGLHLTKEEKAKLSDKYTRNETDNKIASAAMGIIWKPAVETSREFREKYSDIVGVKEGWFVPVNQEGIGYRYTAGKWCKVTMFRQPLVSEDSDGLMSIIQMKKLDSIESGANKYIHPNESSIRHVSDDQIAAWNNKAENSTVTYYQAGLMTPELLMKLESIVPTEPTILKDVKIPIVKTEINTISIGPVNSGADIEVEEDESIHRAFETVFNNFHVRKIILLPFRVAYFTRQPIVIAMNDIEIIGSGATITNGINDPTGKADNFIFNIVGSNVKISDIKLDCSPITAELNKVYGGVNVYGNRNHLFRVNVLGRRGIQITGSDNIVEYCTVRNCTSGITVLSTPKIACQANTIVSNDVAYCTLGIGLGSSYSVCQYNTVKDNVVVDCGTGINIDNVSIASSTVPRFNKVLDNVVSRGSGDPSSYKIDEYTIYINGQNNIIGGNLLRGKGVTLNNDYNRLYQNYEIDD